ncbi:MAG: M20/M25/M40 family metallo-hydrolase, partial [Myxococcota bacterium]
APAVLMAHQDVVPVEEGTESLWTHPAFSGAIADGAVWGRGTLDDKNCVLGILEAAESALEAGLTPKRTVYLAFGHDEEIGGKGATAIAERLAGQGVRPGFVLDEGLAVVNGLVPGVSAPVAMVGIAEKGYATLRLSADGVGGHSSMPPENTAVGILARAIARLEADPFPARIVGPAREFLEFVGPEASFGYRTAFTNLWLFEPVLARVFAGSPSTAALIRTTTAATMFSGSPKDNVLPQRASAAINFRILTGETTETVKSRVREVIDDPRVELAFDTFASDPSPVSDVTGGGFLLLQATLQEVYPGAIVAPSLVLAATDSRHFSAISDQVFRFSPFNYHEAVGDQIHGTDEHIPIDDYLSGIRFYRRLIEHL